MLVFLIQSAIAVSGTAPSDALASHLVQFAVAIILALNLWMVRAVQQTRELVRKLDQWAFGAKGDNGVDSTVTDHEHRLTQCEGYILRTVPERLIGWEKWRHEVDAFLRTRRSTDSHRDHNEETDHSR